MRFLRRAWFWMRRRRMESDFEEEVRQHLEWKAEAGIAQGQSSADAWRSARLDFGNAALAKEQSRHSWGFPSLESVLQDLRFAVRQLRRQPGFTAAVVLTLGLGIGANVAIFSVIYSVLVRPLPFKDSGRLLIIRKQNPPRSWVRNAISPHEFLAWHDQTTTFDDMAAYTSRSCVLNNGKAAEEDPCEIITANLFSVLGVAPAQGRSFAAEEDGPGRSRTVILSYGLWQRRFGGDPAAVGRSVQLNGEPATVVGVMPAGFSHLYASPYESIPEMWVSGIALSPEARWNDYVGIGRLRAQATLAQAQTEMDGISVRVEQAHPDLKGWRAQLMTLRAYTGDTWPALAVLMGAVTFVLLIACANVANLLLARGAVRTGEFALRKALGASQARLVRQLLTESLLLSLCAGCLGIMLAWLGIRTMPALAPASLLKSAQGLPGAATDVRVLAFAVAVAVLTTLLFGLAPAIQSARLAVAEAVKESGHTSLDSPRRRRFRGGLVVSEIALAMVLLVGAGLMVRTLVEVSRVQLGFSPANVLTLRVPLAGAHYKDPQAVVDFWQRVTVAVEALPGVESASVSWGVPLDDWNGLYFTTAERPDPPPGQVPDANYLAITTTYFQTMRIPLVRGRPFNQHDGENGDHVAIVNEELARTQWPGQDPLGKRLRITAMTGDAPWLSVIGVARNILTQGPVAGFHAEVYVPYNQLPWVLSAPKHLAVRTKPGVAPESVANAVIREIHGMDKEQPVTDVRTMEEIARATRTNERMLMTLLGAFAGLALILSAVGIYSVLSYSVAQRTREIGVRVALGAQRADVLRLVVGGGFRLTLLGIGAGLAAAILLTRLMTELLYGVRATDAMTFLAVTLILAAASASACYIPARRAARIEPMAALRHE
jgi:putative ABC transport system permease protein